MARLTALGPACLVRHGNNSRVNHMNRLCQRPCLDRLIPCCSRSWLLQVARYIVPMAVRAIYRADRTEAVCRGVRVILFHKRCPVVFVMQFQHINCCLGLSGHKFRHVRVILFPVGKLPVHKGQPLTPGKFSCQTFPEWQT